ncbi:hypothetical protein [Tropicimonas isoalkanivorans]|uniref:Extracellular solute-binding protein, family 7 n=1 Tax=Tropicimonas isoalkanivorans TaxID=441112 RepID=A0A1I1HY66_9RHOB|nr:hypothetical protein [Tropicimonas isoalkanivorans]SFC28512.1 extracellular solute-binding protein, family 7 [Tropicimonas isoalkanivorans]
MTTQADFAGKRMRGSGSMGQLAAELGASPVNVAFNKIYEALQRAQLDCVLLDPGQLLPLRLGEVLDSVTEVTPGNFQSIGQVGVNFDLWRGFTRVERQIWLDVAPGAIADYQ